MGKGKTIIAYLQSQDKRMKQIVQANLDYANLEYEEFKQAKFSKPDPLPAPEVYL